MYTKFINWLERYLILFVVSGFIAGIVGAAYSQGFIDGVNSIIDAFMNAYDYLAPIAIFLILTPALTKLFSTRKMGKFGLFVIRWYAVRKILACFWAIAFIAVVLRLPLMPESTTSITAAVIETVKSLGVMATTSPYFWAMYAAIGMSLLSLKVKWLYKLFDTVLNSVEAGGKFFIPIMPVFMLGIGAYVYALPQNVAEQVGLEGEGLATLTNLNIWGWQLDPTTSAGMIGIYVVGALLTAVACMLWQLVFLYITAKKEKRFTIKSYFKDYWVRVYPLLWATSSEALATPLNLYLVKKYAPWVRDNIRRFTVGIGSYMNINGTLINVFILGAIVLQIIGLNVSVMELVLIIPIVFLISYGVPGIPGELVLFAGPMALLLDIPEPIVPLFLAVYLGLQIGLSDSFRTGNNSTDDHIGTIYMNAVYEQEYANSEEEEPAFT
ncbi:MAG: Na+/H+-dicarboxylate symporter [Oceanicoccus sp.]|jgi:Na+/H+-dicarboxylate symporter